MVFTSSYNALFLEVVIWINYVLAIILLGFLSQRFISWFRSNHNAAVLAYAIAIMTICINSVFTLLFLTNQFTHSFSGPIVQPALTPVANYSRLFDIFNVGYVITSVISFVLTWIATVLLLHSYSRRLGRARYWILVCIPLVFFFEPISAFVCRCVYLFSYFTTDSFWSGIHIVFRCNYTRRWGFIWYCVLERRPEYRT